MRPGLVMTRISAKERGQEADGKNSDEEDDGEHVSIIGNRYH
jgi:hypothetical protein